VFSLFSQRLLTLLQLTRMALVFTAISNSLCALLLWAKLTAADEGESVRDYISFSRVLAVVIVSSGLSGFGMALNDINDRRRDSQTAAHRAVPSGRISIVAANAVCVMLAVAALLGGVAVARFTGAGWMSFMLVVWTLVLILFYDFAGKYLVAPGLIALGLIRFFHATIAAPRLPLLWHPLLLLNHVTILSTICYAGEAMRPALTKVHWWAVLGGLGLVDVACVALVGYRRAVRTGATWHEALVVNEGLIYPLVAIAGFVALALFVRHVAGGTRRGGQTLMLYGLLWLIVYDASFAAGYVSWFSAACLLLLLPLSYLSVQLMRWWGKILSLSQKPDFQRAR
jgi:hypothetical protein